MPIYEYECSQCGHQLESFQNVSEAPLTLCPKCNAQGLNKLISNTSFQLKGSGWYKTDYEKAKPAATDKNENKTNAANDKTTNAKEVETKKSTETKSTDKKSDSSDSKAV